jgi:putative acetyltransferase
MQNYTYNGYTIREILPSDNPDVAILIRYNLKTNGLDIPGTVYFDACVDDIYGVYAGRERCGYYVLVNEHGKVVGGIGYDTLDFKPGYAELQKMYLDDSVKGQGLSYVLISFIEDRMRETGFTTSYLETHSNLTTAIHVYEKSGYKLIDRPEEVGHGAMDHFYTKNLT